MDTGGNNQALGSGVARIIIDEDDVDDESIGTSLVAWKSGMETVSTTFAATLIGRKGGSSGLVIKHSCSLDPPAFNSFTNNFRVSKPSFYIEHLNIVIPPWDSSVLPSCRHYIRSDY